MLGFAVLAAALAGPSGSVLGYVLFGALVADIVGLVAAWRDTRALTAAGDPIARKLAWWCLLTPWAYLGARAVKRARRSNTDWMLLVASLATWLLIIVVSIPVIKSVMTDSTTFRQTRMEADIASGIKIKSGFAVKVSCPQVHPTNPGSQFQCAAIASDGVTILVTVTIRDRSGAWSWHPIGG
jgi:hypothetical protein